MATVLVYKLADDATPAEAHRKYLGAFPDGTVVAAYAAARECADRLLRILDEPDPRSSD